MVFVLLTTTHHVLSTTIKHDLDIYYFVDQLNEKIHHIGYSVVSLEWTISVPCCNKVIVQGPLLLSWFNFIPCMYTYSHQL